MAQGLQEPPAEPGPSLRGRGFRQGFSEQVVKEHLSPAVSRRTGASDTAAAASTSSDSPVQRACHCACFIEEEAEAQRSRPARPGPHSLEAAALALWLQSRKRDPSERGLGSPGSDGPQSWAKEFGLALQANYYPFS